MSDHSDDKPGDASRDTAGSASNTTPGNETVSSPDLDAIAETACQMTQEHGSFGALFHIYGTKGQAIASAVEILRHVGEARRRAARDLGAQVAREGRCGQLVSVVQISEGYMRLIKQGQYNAAGEQIDVLAPSEAPDRVEILVIAALTRDRSVPTGGRLESRLYKMLREHPGDARSWLLGLERVPDLEAPTSGPGANSPLLHAFIQGYSFARPPTHD